MRTADGLRNFTDTSNPAKEDEQQNKDRYDANAAAGNRGHGSGEPGVIEAEPGLMESTKLDPLIPDSESSVPSSTGQAKSTLDSVVDAAKDAYESITKT